METPRRRDGIAGRRWRNRADGRFALLLVVFVTILMLVKLDAGAGKRTQYVEFLDREVPVSELNEKVRMHDASFKDYGAAGKQGARSAFGLTGEGVTIAIVDTGVSLGIEEGEQHEQLDGNTVVGDVDFIDPGTPGDDCNGHGTHVASIAAGNGGASKDAKLYRGVAPRASILAVRVLDCLGRGTVGTVISGIAWAVENGADIISMSLGMGGSNTALNDAVDIAVSRGVVVIASTGFGAASLWLIDAATAELTRTIELGGSATGAADTRGPGVWAVTREGTATRVDLGSGEMQASVETGKEPSAVAAGAQAVWVAIREPEP